MNCAFRYVLILSFSGLVLGGCGGARSGSISERPQTRSGRTTQYSPALIGDDRSSNGQMAQSPPAQSPDSDVRHDISLEEVREHVRNNSAVLIDARSPESFAKGHVRGALNVPAGAIEAHVPQIKESISEDELLVIYCASSSCGAGDTVYRYLASQGYTNMRVYKPGWQQLAQARNVQ